MVMIVVIEHVDSVNSYHFISFFIYNKKESSFSHNCFLKCLVIQTCNDYHRLARDGETTSKRDHEYAFTTILVCLRSSVSLF